MRILITGCGYVGTALGAELSRLGHEVFGVRRSAAARSELEAAGIRLITADISDRESLDQIPGGFDWIVNTVATGGGDAEAYRQAYLKGTKNLIARFAADPPKKFVYTSSTGVYGQSDGKPVKEESPTEPQNDTGRVLVETEKVLRDAFREKQFPAIILRPAGIYGPGRCYWIRKLISKPPSINVPRDRYLNMVHIDDLVGALIEVLQDAHAGTIFNVADDEPVTVSHFLKWLSDSLGIPIPPLYDKPSAEGERRHPGNKRVLNRKLKMELGYSFKYPTFREGYTAEITKLEQAGELESGIKTEI
ncbi:MAG: SDR family oxidoreductase [Verrucomicrobia bacterium]|nr:SDR family oxidoreductase [Verrucomicrobiota bacterium]